MVEENPTLYVSAARPVIVYLPSAEVDADPKPTLVPWASTNTPPKALPDAFVTLPVMVAPGIIVASTPVLVAPAVTLIGVAVVWDGCPLYHWASKLLGIPTPGQELHVVRAGRQAECGVRASGDCRGKAASDGRADGYHEDADSRQALVRQVRHLSRHAAGGRGRDRGAAAPRARPGVLTGRCLPVRSGKHDVTGIGHAAGGDGYLAVGRV